MHLLICTHNTEVTPWWAMLLCHVSLSTPSGLMYGYTQSGAEAMGTSFANLTGYPIPPGFSRTIIPSLLFGSLISATDPGMECIRSWKEICSTAFPHPDGTLVSCPPHTMSCLEGRNHLVNKVEFLGLIPQNCWWRPINEIARLVIIT